MSLLTLIYCLYVSGSYSHMYFHFAITSDFGVPCVKGIVCKYLIYSMIYH
jgi:hypothetical protein